MSHNLAQACRMLHFEFVAHSSLFLMYLLVSCMFFFINTCTQTPRACAVRAPSLISTNEAWLFGVYMNMELQRIIPMRIT